MKKFNKVGGIVFILSAFLFAGVQVTNATSAKQTRSLYDNPRVLIITGMEEDISQQLDLFRGQENAIKQRDILTLLQPEKSQSLSIIKNFSEPDFHDDDPIAYQPYLSDAKTGVFNLILIGKDKGVKEIWFTPTLFKDIAEVIDQMFMRRQEMR